MTRDHFSKVMQNPYFQSAHYQNDTNGGKMESKIEDKIKKILNKIMIWRKT